MDVQKTVSVLRSKLQDTYEKHWKAQINGFNSTDQHKLRTYCEFKNEFEKEFYLNQNLLTQKRIFFSKLGLKLLYI